MKKLVFAIFCLISVLIIQDLIRSVITLWQKRDVLTAKQEELARVKKEYAMLKEKEKQVNDPQFAEGEMRNKLFLVKPDEKIVVLPTDFPLREGKEKEEFQGKSQKPAYEQWLDLFLKGGV